MCLWIFAFSSGNCSTYTWKATCCANIQPATIVFQIRKVDFREIEQALLSPKCGRRRTGRNACITSLASGPAEAEMTLDGIVKKDVFPFHTRSHVMHDPRLAGAITRTRNNDADVF
jgi:hypothetical protein